MICKMPNQGSVAGRRPAGQSDGSGESAPACCNRRSSPSGVAELGHRYGTMTTAELVNRSVRFDPQLDLENLAEVPELPGKEAMQDTLQRLGKTMRCSRLIQDSHGWCFYAHADDGRKYLIELSYVATEKDASSWGLSCSRCAGLRAWEWLGGQTPNLGQEQLLLGRAVEVLVSHHGYERA
jgi:hypothetical protein